MESRVSRHDRQQLEILTTAECLELIDAAPVGRVGFNLDGAPLILPVTHLRYGNGVVFRTTDGAKLDAARGAPRVAFEVDGIDTVRRTGWSVLAVGTATLADEITAIHLETQSLLPWADGVPRNHWVVITFNDVTGRRIPGAQTGPPDQVTAPQNDPGPERR